jgi:hypothetical protein
MAISHTHDNAMRFPTRADIEHYETYGFVVSPPIIPQDLIDEAVFGADRYYAGERDWRLPMSGGFLDWRPAHGACLRINDYVSLQNREFRNLIVCGSLGHAFSVLSGCDTIRLFHDQLISKPPGIGDSGAIGWHVDRAYWQTCTSPNMLTAWIPLVDYELDMGPVMMLSASHRWHGHDWMTTFNQRDLPALEQRIDSGGHRVERVPILIRPGQVSFHHAGTIHGSLPNCGRRSRLALTVHVQGGDNRYRRHVDCRGKLATHVNDALCRKGVDGMPDYSDPDICPVIWPCRQGASA